MSVWSDIHKRSNGQFRKEDAYTFQETAPEELTRMMKQGIVHFKYRKKARKGQPWDSGIEREAWGTKKMEIVSSIPHGGDCPPKGAGYTTYFDVEKADWRVYMDGLLLGVCPHIFTEDEFNDVILSGE